MNLGRTTLNKVYFFSLLVFPSIYILLSYFFNSIQPLYSLKSVDPEYAYFMSGLNLSLLKFNLGHIDHPGSPLQYILAICFRCTYLFRTTELPYIEDVLLNSDSYLSIANFVVNSILSLMLVFIGFKCFKITNNIAYSLLLQTTPFITQITYDSLGRITPEPLMLIPISLLALYLFEFFFNKKKPDSTKEIFILGFISGLALSIKLTCIPLWIIPIVIIPGMRKKFIFIGIATLSFLTISIPVLIKIEQFWHWGKNLFLHSGDYGQ